MPGSGAFCVSSISDRKVSNSEEGTIETKGNPGNGLENDAKIKDTDNQPQYRH